MRRISFLSSLVLSLLIVPAAALSGAERHTGPWDLERLATPPEVEWIDRTEVVQSLYYTGVVDTPQHQRRRETNLSLTGVQAVEQAINRRIVCVADRA